MVTTRSGRGTQPEFEGLATNRMPNVSNAGVGKKNQKKKPTKEVEENLKRMADKHEAASPEEKKKLEGRIAAATVPVEKPVEMDTSADNGAEEEHHEDNPPLSVRLEDVGAVPETPPENLVHHPPAEASPASDSDVKDSDVDTNTNSLHPAAESAPSKMSSADSLFVERSDNKRVISSRPLFILPSDSIKQPSGNGADGDAYVLAREEAEDFYDSYTSVEGYVNTGLGNGGSRFIMIAMHGAKSVAKYRMRKQGTRVGPYLDNSIGVEKDNGIKIHGKGSITALQGVAWLPLKGEGLLQSLNPRQWKTTGRTSWRRPTMRIKVKWEDGRTSWEKRETVKKCWHETMEDTVLVAEDLIMDDVILLHEGDRVAWVDFGIIKAAHRCETRFRECYEDKTRLAEHRSPSPLVTLKQQPTTRGQKAAESASSQEPQKKPQPSMEAKAADSDSDKRPKDAADEGASTAPEKPPQPTPEKPLADAHPPDAADSQPERVVKTDTDEA